MTEASVEILDRVDRTRSLLSPLLDQDQRSELGQFMTPAPIARFMASLFSADSLQRGRLLDAGAGVGSLTAAFLERCAALGRGGFAAHLWEIDEALRTHIQSHLDGFMPRVLETLVVSEADFIEHAARDLYRGADVHFTHAILNPPYRKLGASSPHRTLLRSCGLETGNLYSGFVGLALSLMQDKGEIVAIIPRSFCNGPYFRPFREFLLQKSAIMHLHLFDSRRSAFSDDKVLQENIIIKLAKGRAQGDVTVSTSRDASLSDMQSTVHPFEAIVSSTDAERFISIPSGQSADVATCNFLGGQALAAIGLEVSTGPVVDFRLRESLRVRPEEGAVPLLYANHFVGGKLQWPKEGKKPNAILVGEETRRWLMPRGHYTVVKRFSSKEEKRRIVAYVVEAEQLPEDLVGVENHLNVFHRAKRGLSRDEAHGVATFLNSTAVDQYFRRFSGHTQVNATDLRKLPYPSIDRIRELGTWARSKPDLTQEEIDKKVLANE